MANILVVMAVLAAAGLVLRLSVRGLRVVVKSTAGTGSRTAAVPAPGSVCRLSLVIPASNEAGRIRETIIRAAQYLEELGQRAEIVVIDDGSRDGTAGIVQDLEKRFPFLRVVSLSVNRGKGAAVHRWILEARGELLLFFDADLSFPVEEMNKFLAGLDEGFDVVIGRRENLDDAGEVAAWRRLVSPAARNLPRWLG